jgi:hypothetical protein
MEWLKNLVTPISERVRSPFYGTFIISWLIWNWQLVFAFLSGETNVKGLHIIDFVFTRVNLSTFFGWLNAVICPLIMTIVYLFVISRIEVRVFEFLEKIKQEKLNKKYMVGRKYTVSGERHVDLLLSYNSQKDSLAKLESSLIEREEEIIKQEKLTNQIKSELNAKDKKYGDMMDRITSMENMLDKMEHDKFQVVFNDTWVCFWRESGKGSEWLREEFVISENNKYNRKEKENGFTQLHELLLLSKGNDDGIRFMKRGLADNINQFKKVNLKKSDDGTYSGTEEEYIGKGTITKRYDVRYMPLEKSIKQDLRYFQENKG